MTAKTDIVQKDNICSNAETFVLYARNDNVFK